MRVVVTRPAVAGAVTVQKLLAAGHEAIPLPLFHAEHVLTEDSARTLHDFGALILTSAEAVRALQAAGVSLSDFQGKVFAVGKATARAACGIGCRKIEVAEGDGAALAGLIAARIQPAQGPLLYLAGETRSSVLERSLEEAGFSVVVRVAYRMVETVYTKEELRSLLLSGHETVILLYSRQNALRFRALLDAAGLTEAARRFTFLCLSAAIADVLDGLASSGTMVAPERSEETLLALLPPVAGR